MTRVLCLLLLALAGCTGKPANIKPVENFQADKYLGTWYEIARIDNRFEKGLSATAAASPSSTAATMRKPANGKHRPARRSSSTANSKVI